MSEDNTGLPAGEPALPKVAGEPHPGCGFAMEAVNSAVPIEALERLCMNFQITSQRREMIIYPSMIALVAMVGGAFLFIYTVTRDIRDLALKMQPEVGLNINKVAESVTLLSSNLEQMSRNMDSMRSNIQSMSADVSSMSKQMQSLNEHMAHMDASMTLMNAQADAMRWNMQTMSQSISRPMGMMNRIMPW